MSNDPNLHQAYFLRVKYSERSEKPSGARQGVADDKQEEPGDVTSFVCVRNAIKNTASFSIMTIQLPIEYFLQLQTYITKGTFPQVQCELELVNTRDRSCKEYPFGKPVLQKPIFKKELQMIYIKAIEDVIPEKRVIHALIVLNDPLLYSLGNRLTYNKVIAGKPIDYLTSFENYLAGIYNNPNSAPTFKFHRIANDKFVINHHMSQMLMKPKADIQIPKMLISWYKVYQTPTLYFFDEFRCDKENEASINCYLINFGDIEKFKKGADFREPLNSGVEEIQATQNIKQSYPLIDPNSPLLTPITKLDVYDYNMYYLGNSFTNENFKLPYYHNEILKQEYLEKPGEKPRELMTIEQRNLLMHNKNVQTYIELYAPDTAKLAVERYTLTKETYKLIPTIEEYSFTNTLFESFQFGYRYNLNLIDSIIGKDEYEQYVFTPVCIVNIFHRATGPEPLLRHTARIQFAKFADDVLKHKKELDYNKKITNNEGKNINSKPGKETPANTGQDNKTESKPENDNKTKDEKMQDIINSSQNIKCNEDIINNKDGIKDKLKLYIKTRNKNLSDQEIEKIIGHAVKTENPHLVIATIAKESNFNRTAVNHNKNGSTDYGLMQLNVPAGSSAAQVYGKYGVTSNEQLFDIDTNMKIGIDKLFRKNIPSTHGKTTEAQQFYQNATDLEKAMMLYGGASTLTGMKFVLANLAYDYQNLKNFLGGVELKPSDPSCQQNTVYKGGLRNMTLDEINQYNQEWARVNNVTVKQKPPFMKPPKLA